MQLAKYSLTSIDLRTSIESAIQKGISGLHKPEPLKLSEWADENFYLSAESSSVQGAWETLPYQKAIMNCISNDDIGIVTWMKSARVGYTKIICSAIGYFAEHKKRNQVIWQPTDSDAEEFVKDEIDPLIRDVPVVKGALKCDPEKKSKDNTLSKKVFKGSTLDIKGGKAARNYRRMTKDVAYYDELDGFDPDVEKEGAPPVLGDKRLETSSFPKSIRGSTPKTKGESLTEQSLSESDLVFERYLPCPHCNELSPLRWEHMKFVDKDPNQAGHACIHCGGLAEYSDYAEMDAKGQWQTECGKWIDDDDMLRNENNLVIEFPFHVGFKIWSAYSYFKSWAKIGRDFFDANAAKKIGNLTKLKTFINTTLGETWEEEGEKADDNLLFKRREHYEGEVPNEVKVLTAFIDVQDDRVECEVEGWAAGEENWAIDYYRLYGNLSQKTIWNNLEKRLRKQYRYADGRLIDIKLVGIDSGGHYTDEAYEFSKSAGITWVIPTKGASIAGKPIAVFPKTKNKKGIYLTMLGTDTAKELIYNRYLVDDPGPGYIHHPVAEWCDEDYFKQATAEEKIKKYKLGKPYYEWDAKKRRNEVLDCKVGNLAMIRLLQEHFGQTLLNKDSTPAPKKRRVISKGVKL